MAFIDIKDPKKRVEIVADYLSTIRKVQQRNEDEKSAGLAHQAELRETFSPIVKATEKATRDIAEKIEPLHDELKTVSDKINANTRLPLILRRKRKWDERVTGLTALDYYLHNYDQKSIDKYYSIKREKDGVLMLGNKEVFVDGHSNITIDGTVYKQTPGLWELIMLTSPNENSYTDDDKDVYRDIAARTDLMNNPRDVTENSRPRTTAKRKMMEGLLFPQQEPKEGTGVVQSIEVLSDNLQLLTHKFDNGDRSVKPKIIAIMDELYLRRKEGGLTWREYWNRSKNMELTEKEGSGVVQFLPGDIKGLETKLNLLLAEFKAGNTSTRNEIVSILDVLLRRKRISRKEYTEINAYLSCS